ncbi:hypothetical protein A2442_02765 [Candidatus Campbellbacteria bacterium RIFOXYC2_FULL_35_25]|uniref:Uncharacterized protein n=1 Tax=Candidatus Campbellbacteria bacterium RIFOXYC2_FULL_35_25 TaxID=1797582 RepID=A0A1F5EJ64_9BACT|nr:MAG: hypothetical protein A2442_02765 [Candidatus Campbellbacteria bacterium RIFOXYC2_FULL_35_25]
MAPSESDQNENGEFEILGLSQLFDDTVSLKRKSSPTTGRQNSEVPTFKEDEQYWMGLCCGGNQ